MALDDLNQFLNGDAVVHDEVVTKRPKLAFHAGLFGNTLGQDFQGRPEIRRPNLGEAREGSEVVTDQEIDQRAWGVWAQDRLFLGHDVLFFNSGEEGEGGVFARTANWFTINSRRENAPYIVGK